MIEPAAKEQALARRPGLPRFGDRRLQWRRRQRVPGVHRQPHARRPRGRRHRRQPQLPGAPSRARHPDRQGLRSATRDHQDRELDNPEYRANPANRCYFCKHELYTHLSRIAADRHAVVVDGNNADDRGDYRPGPSGGARVRRPQSARRSEPHQGRDPRAVAPRRPADMGRAGVGMSVVAHSVSQRSDRREAADDRTRRAGGARAGLPRLPRAAPRRSGARRDRARRDAARARAGDRRRDRAGVEGAPVIATSRLDLQGYRLGSLNEGLFLRPM